MTAHTTAPASMKPPTAPAECAPLLGLRLEVVGGGGELLARQHGVPALGVQVDEIHVDAPGAQLLRGDGGLSGGEGARLGVGVDDQGAMGRGG